MAKYRVAYGGEVGGGGMPGSPTFWLHVISPKVNTLLFFMKSMDEDSNKGFDGDIRIFMCVLQDYRQGMGIGNIGAS